MRKFLVIALVVAILFVLGSLFLPTRLDVRQEVAIANNKRVVEQKLQNLDVFKEWLVTQGREPIIRDNAIYWDEATGQLRAELTATDEGVVLEAKNLNFYENFRAVFEVKEEGKKLTQLTLKLTSSPTLNPLVRYTYALDNKKIKERLDGGLAFLKKECEAVNYERFHLSMPIIEAKDDLVFCFPRHATPSTLVSSKSEEIDSLYRNRLKKYEALDTLNNAFLQYTQWNDSLVNYTICLPLLKSPTRKQLMWLTGGKIARVKGQFYTANYSGNPQDLPLAWDSLYVILKEKGVRPQGLPLEQLIKKTDSTEQRKLFIQIR